MLLSDWLIREGVKRSDFAQRIGVSAATITDLCQGKQWLSKKTARAIEIATDGAVTAADFVHIEHEAESRPTIADGQPTPSEAAD